MKRVVCAFLILLCLLPLPASAIESTAYTYTLSLYWWFIRTQDAYIPGSVILRELDMESPEDMFLQGDTLYIADTGNGRVLRYEMQTGVVTEIGRDILKQPMGVCADRQGNIYVADYKAQSVVILDGDGNLLRTITRPEADLYGANTAFKPQKVAVDSYGNLYVTSEGTHEGILQFDINGSFAGFFGANRVGPLQLMDRITDLIYTEEQRARQPRRNPMRIVNLDVSDENYVYSLSQYSSQDAVKQLNMAGINVMDMDHLFADDTVVDVAVTRDGGFYTLTDNGNIVEYESSGIILFAFGGRAVSNDRNGLTSVASAICVDEASNVYVLDKQRGVVQPYAATDFARDIHRGLSLYQNGRYAEASDVWRDFIRLTPMSYFAHALYGLALWQAGDWEEAYGEMQLASFSLQYASDVYWEMRNEWLINNLPYLFAGLLAFVAAVLVVKRLDRKRKILMPFRLWWRARMRGTPVIRALRTMLRMISHPMDTLDDIKHNLQGSLASAMVLYLLALVVYLADLGFAAPLFNSWAFRLPGNSPYLIVASVAVPAILFVIGNYFIASINDGEGSFRHVVISLGYALSFYILITPCITAISYALTANEAFVITLLRILAYGYSVVLIFLSAKEIHGYSFGQTLKNLFLTCCFVGLALLAMAILYLLWNELFGFIETLIEEVHLRA